MEQLNKAKAYVKDNPKKFRRIVGVVVVAVIIGVSIYTTGN